MMVVIEASLLRLRAISVTHTRPRLLTVSRRRRRRGEDRTSEARPLRPPARRHGVARPDRASHSRRRQVRRAYPRESPSVSNSVHGIHRIDSGSIRSSRAAARDFPPKQLMRLTGFSRRVIHRVYGIMVVIEASLLRLCAISATHTRPRLLTVSRWRRQRGEDRTSEARPFRPPARRQGVPRPDRASHSRRRQVRCAYPRESPSVSSSVRGIHRIDSGSIRSPRSGSTGLSPKKAACPILMRLTGFSRSVIHRGTGLWSS